MSGIILPMNAPAPENGLRDLAKNASRALPTFTEKEAAIGVKELHDLVDPILETADLPDLSPGHRAAASNALCAIIECCQSSTTEYARAAILDDSIWTRFFNIYLQRSDDAKGKSMRQTLLVLTAVIAKDQSLRASELRLQTAAVFMDIICDRQDRIKVKPALQGLAHFLLRDVVSIAQLVEISSNLTHGHLKILTPQSLFKTFLAWIVHHDTALSAGHLVKNFLIQARRLPEYGHHDAKDAVAPLWIEPVVQTLHHWPDRVREFKTHVFPHCFLPNIDEYMRFLSYLHFSRHVQTSGVLPEVLHTYELQNNGLNRVEEFKILLASIEAGKELTVVRDTDYRVSEKIEVQGSSILLPDNIFGAWMSHSEPEVRLAGMFLSVYSTAITKPMTGGVFRSLKRNLVHLHTDTDANFRREVHGYTQKLFDRLRASTATLAKSQVKAAGNGQRIPFFDESLQKQRLSPNTQDPLPESLAFIVWFVSFLEWELRPTASYQRRITALRSLIIVLRSGIDPGVPHAHLSKSAQGQLTWAHGLQISNPKLTRVLLDLILDPFDDIREASVLVLQLCLVALPDAQRGAVLSTLPRFISRAEAAMLRTGRADHADGVARAYSLIYSLASEVSSGSTDLVFPSKFGVFERLRKQLKDTLDIAHSNLSEAVNGRPIHGTFAALTYIVDQEQFYTAMSSRSTENIGEWKKAHNDIVACFESLWSCVYHVLCADAPEGNVPEEMDEDVIVDTREVLSYSWRGLKEASVLIRTIISKASIGNEDSAMLTPELFEKLGQLCFTQLLELRHRGAHSTVAQTFAAFCRRCATSDIALLRALPGVWYQETLRSMQEKAGAITRRSAGIPTLMAGIIAAEPQIGGKLLARAMKDLVAEASVEAQSANIEESRLPQVHALNCVKEIFTTSKLSVPSEAYIGQGLELAAKMLNSNVWPIRNCSLMLFKALIERLLGSNEAQDWKERDRAKTSRFSYDNYPSLVGILSDLLDPNGPLKQSLKNTPDSSSPLDLHGAEGVFPALQILRQARPPDGVLEPILKSVEKLLASPHWHLRDMAARTLVSLRPSHQLYDAAVLLFSRPPASHNSRHGALLGVKYMLRKLLRDTASLNIQNFEKLMEEFSRSVQQWHSHSQCPFVDTVLLDIVSLCGTSLLQRCLSTSSLKSWTVITSTVGAGPEHILGLSGGDGDALLREALARLVVIDRIIVRPDSSNTVGATKPQSLSDALMLLATDDADTCCAVLESLNSIMQKCSSSEFMMPVSSVMVLIHQIVLQATDAEVISKAQSVLADALTDDASRADFFALISVDQTLRTLTHLESQCLEGPPSNMQSALYLLGVFLDHAFHTCIDQRRIVLETTVKYIRLLRVTIVDNNPFDTRFAAVQSLYTLTHIWTASRRSPQTQTLLLALSLVLNDLLNDDDDEIRDIAALATANLLQAQHSPATKSAVPLLISHRLAGYLSSTFADSSALATEALRRLTNTPAPAVLFATPCAHMLAANRTQDNALFATEKQNLYRDDALDAVFWARVLSTLSPAALSVAQQQGLRSWVVDALEVLGDTADAEVDAALGWTSKPEVFALVVRVLSAIDVVLDSGAAEDQGRVRSALRMFLDRAEAAEMHGLLLGRGEEVLRKSVVAILAKVRESLICSRLC